MTIQIFFKGCLGIVAASIIVYATRYYPPVNALTDVKTCPLHGEILHAMSVPVFYGFADYEDGWAEMRKELAPFSKTMYVVSWKCLRWRKRAIISVCPKCCAVDLVTAWKNNNVDDRGLTGSSVRERRVGSTQSTNNIREEVNDAEEQPD